MEDIRALLAAHSPDPQSMRTRCTLCYGEHISIATLIKSAGNILPAFVHSHDEYEFLLPHTPIPFLVHEETIYFGEVGWVFPVPSGHLHGIKYELSDVSHNSIVINKDFFDALLHEKGKEGAKFNAAFRLSENLRFYIHTFQHEFEKGHDADKNKLRHITALLCIELIETGIVSTLDAREEKHTYQKGIRFIAEYLNDNYQQAISIAQLAAMCGFSKSYFITVFKNTLGESPHAYLGKLRISRAKVLLETTTAPIHEIAKKCGFKKANSFTSLFKTLTGTTPKQYRDAANL